MGRWLEHTVTSNIDAPVEQVWSVWSDLEAMPLWMSWIESVKTIDESVKIRIRQIWACSDVEFQMIREPISITICCLTNKLCTSQVRYLGAA